MDKIKVNGKNYRYERGSVFEDCGEAYIFLGKVVGDIDLNDENDVEYLIWEIKQRFQEADDGN